jgi:hypothetical protein
VHYLLNKLFEKRGVKDVGELTPIEAEDFERWQKILNKEKLEVSDISEFCETQVKVIEKQFENLDNIKKKDDKLIMQYVVYKKLLDLIEAPSRERETLIRYLESLTK